VVDEGTGKDHSAFSAGVRDLLVKVSGRMSAHWVMSADELLNSDEPNEALLQIAWGIASEHVAVDEPTVTFIKESVGSRHELPPELA
jgi:hypothetical protein